MKKFMELPVEKRVKICETIEREIKDYLKEHGYFGPEIEETLEETSNKALAQYGILDDLEKLNEHFHLNLEKIEDFMKEDSQLHGEYSYFISKTGWLIEFPI